MIEGIAIICIAFTLFGLYSRNGASLLIATACWIGFGVYVGDAVTTVWRVISFAIALFTAAYALMLFTRRDAEEEDESETEYMKLLQKELRRRR